MQNSDTTFFYKSTGNTYTYVIIYIKWSFSGPFRPKHALSHKDTETFKAQPLVQGKGQDWTRSVPFLSPTAKPTDV